jgi:hypothetical protein
MTAYSFKRRFVVPIARGLGVPYPVDFIETLVDRPKRQTIRADRKRHARPGEELQLYCAMRTKHCFLIGRARCLATARISLFFDFGKENGLAVNIEGKMLTPLQTAAFARADGFADIDEMKQFWRDAHGPVDKWQGILIRWEPLT